MKKVLMVANKFPPAGGSGVQRTVKFAKYLEEFGWQPYILTVEKQYKEFTDESFFSELPANIAIYRTPIISAPDPFVWMVKKGEQENWKKLAFKIKIFFRKCVHRMFRELLPIDIFSLWVPFALSKGKKVIADQKIDLIYVTGGPFSTFLVGYFLKKISRKPLVLDYRDSWSTYPFKKKGLRSRIDSFLEKKILSFADKVITAKWVSKESILQKFPSIPEDKFLVITNGYDSSDFENIISVKDEKNKLEIIYTGMLWDVACYSPLTFLRALKILITNRQIDAQAIESRVIGGMYKQGLELIKDMQLNEVVKFLGYLNHKECIKEMIKSDVLLFIIESFYGWEYSQKWSGVIPAKIFEYIYADKPIFAIVPQGFESELIAQTGMSFIAQSNNIEDVKTKLMEIYNSFKKGTLKCKNSHRQFIEKYARKNLTKSLSSVFNEVLDKSREAGIQ